MYIIRKRVPVPSFLRHPPLDPACFPFLKSLFPLPSFLFHPISRYFRQFPGPIHRPYCCIDILVTSRNGDRQIMHSIRIINEKTSHENKEAEPVEPVQMNIYQHNIYRKDLTRLYFDHEPRVQERHTLSEGETVLHIHFYCLSNNSK